MSIWGWLWAIWGVLFAASFLAIEIAGLIIAGTQGTLSWHIWQWLGLGQTLTVDYATRRLFLGSFLQWLYWHLMTAKI